MREPLTAVTSERRTRNSLKLNFVQEMLSWACVRSEACRGSTTTRRGAPAVQSAIPRQGGSCPGPSQSTTVAHAGQSAAVCATLHLGSPLGSRISHTRLDLAALTNEMNTSVSVYRAKPRDFDLSWQGGRWLGLGRGGAGRLMPEHPRNEGCAEEAARCRGEGGRCQSHFEPGRCTPRVDGVEGEREEWPNELAHRHRGGLDGGGRAVAHPVAKRRVRKRREQRDRRRVDERDASANECEAADEEGDARGGGAGGVGSCSSWHQAQDDQSCRDEAKVREEMSRRDA